MCGAAIAAQRTKVHRREPRVARRQARCRERPHLRKVGQYGAWGHDEERPCVRAGRGGRAPSAPLAPPPSRRWTYLLTFRT